MNRFPTRLTLVTLVTLALLQFAAPAYAGPLDDHYLQQFGEARSGQLQKALLSVSPEAPQAHRCGMPLKHDLKRDWKLLEMSTQTVLAKQLALPTLSGTPAVLYSSGGNFAIHYSSSGTDAPDIDAINRYTGLVLTSTADWAAKVAESFEKTFSYYKALGYQMPPAYPDQYYHVYMKSLVSESEYGETQNYSPNDIHHNNDYSPVFTGTFASSSPSYITIDKDFTDFLFRPSTYSPQQSLDITSTHEFHHAIQFGYNYYFDRWFAEATSTWFEGEHDLTANTLQLYSYLFQPSPHTSLPAWFTYSDQQLDLGVDMTRGGGYGRWIFDRYLAENYTTSVVLDFWKNLAGRSRTGSPLNSSGDIQMTYVLDAVLSASPYNSGLSTDFFKFTKRVYTRDWSNQANIARIPTFVPIATYATYPVNKSSSKTPSITLPHYSFAYYRFVPTAGVPSLTITIAKNSGIQTAAFRKNSTGVITEIPADTGGSSYTDSDFSSSSEVVLLITNASGTDNHQAKFTAASTSVAPDPVAPDPVAPDPVVPGAASSGGGCFIATAAYGSYLHPQVQLLRQFRDDHLLTTAPGRAFVALYYRCSPPLADFISRHTVLRGVTRILLTPVVMAVVHPAASGAGLLLTVIVLYRPVRRRYLERGASTVPS